MFATFFRELKQAGVPVTPREYLTLMEAIEKYLAGRRIEEFYFARWLKTYSMTAARLHDTTRSTGSAISPAIRCCVS